jgi:two-component sensor histidine kinase
MHYLRANKQCDDTIYQQTKVREIQHLTVQYETDKKNQQIELLSKSDQVHRERQQKAELMRNVSIGGLLVLIIAGLAFYRQYRNKLRMAAVIDQKNKQLEMLLSEKEWLLKEVHHRVKNNLHTVISLLEIQAEFLEDDARKAIENSQHRIYAMSLIHQRLYSEEHPDVIDLSTYVPELVGYLRDSFDKDIQVIYQLNIDPVMVDITVAVPLGLIINEAVSNSNKYAFRGRSGNYHHNNIIDICIQKVNDDVLVRISDNGVGMTINNEIYQTDSLGLKLIRGLCKDLNACLEIKSDKGVHIRIKFPVNEPAIDSQ